MVALTVTVPLSKPRRRPPPKMKRRSRQRASNRRAAGRRRLPVLLPRANVIFFCLLRRARVVDVFRGALIFCFAIWKESRVFVFDAVGNARSAVQLGCHGHYQKSQRSFPHGGYFSPDTRMGLGAVIIPSPQCQRFFHRTLSLGRTHFSCAPPVRENGKKSHLYISA